MKTLLYLLQKELRQIRRNRAILPLVFAVPVVQMMILVYAANFEMKNIDFAIIDQDLSATSRSLTNTFRGNAFFSVADAPASILQGDQLLQKGEADALLIIPARFEQHLLRGEKASLQLLVDAVDGNKAQLIAGYTQSIIYLFNTTMIASIPGAATSASPVFIDISENHWYNPRLDYKWFMAPGILAILVTVIGMFLSGLNLVREKEMGTIEQINVTPVRRWQFILAKLIPFWFIALFDLAFGLAIARLLFNLPVEGSMLVLFSMTGIYLFGILGLGLFLSTMAETQQQLLFLTFFFILVFILMGGIFTPAESMPEWAQMVNRLNPMYYFMKILRMVILKGSGFRDLIPDIVSLFLLGVVFITLAIRRYHKIN